MHTTLPVGGVLVDVELDGTPLARRTVAQYLVSAPLARAEAGDRHITSPTAWARRVASSVIGVDPGTAAWAEQVTPKLEVLRAAWLRAERGRAGWLTTDYLVDALLKGRDCTGVPLRIAAADEAPRGVVIRALEAVAGHEFDYEEGCAACDLALLERGGEALKLLRVDERAIYDVYRALVAARVIREVEQPAGESLPF